jgi:hypothetical protein
MGAVLTNMQGEKTMTDVEKIIEIGQFGFREIVSAMPTFAVAAIIAIPLLYLAFAIYDLLTDYKKWSFVDGEDVIKHVGMILFIVFGITLANYFEYEETKAELVKEWKEDYVDPYLTELDKQKSEIVYIKFDPEIETSIQGGWLFMDSTNQYLTPMTIAYKDNSTVKNLTQWMNTSMTLTPEEEPYVSYVILDQDLGNGVYEGIYNPEVFVPEDYKFTEIK